METVPDPSLDEAVARHVRLAGMATEAQLADARKLAATEALPLAEALVRRGFITPTQRETVETKLEARRDHANELGGYRILKKLGEGGMGAVYLADDPANDRRVAIKVLPKQSAQDPEFVKRFRREAEAAAKLDHPNIVRAYSAGEDKGYHYIVLEYCEGQSLKKRIDQAGFLAPMEATAIVIQIARGLACAHDAGFIHRDVKPENIMLTPGGGAKILDLGLAKNLGDTADTLRTVTGAALGTPHYISPEQARGDRSVDGRTDLYSLGATYYHALTGKTPFSGSSVFEVIQKHLMEQLPDPRDVRPGIPGPAVEVVRRMMAKSLADRYATAGDLLADLERIARKEAPAAPALDPALSSIGRPVRAIAVVDPRRRRRLLVGGGAAALLAAVVVIAWPSPRPTAPDPSQKHPPRVEAPAPPKKDTAKAFPAAAKASPGPVELPFDALHQRNPDVPNARWLELLPMIDVGKHAANGAWQRTAEGIVSPDTGVNANAARIWVPYSPPEEYEVILYVERVKGTEDLVLGLVHRGRPIAVVLDGWWTDAASGSFMNGSWRRYPGAQTRVIPEGRPVRIGCFVRGGGFTVTVDGRVHMAFPDAGPLGFPENLRCPAGRDDGLVIGSVRSSFKVTSVALLPCKGEGRALGP